MFFLEGNKLDPDLGFTHEGITYSSGWLKYSTAEEKTALGITQDNESPLWDDRFYDGYNSDGDLIPRILDDQISELVVPVDDPYGNAYDEEHNLRVGITTTTRTEVFGGLKTSWKDAQDQKAYNLLQPTDWAVVRNQEIGVDVPEKINTFRTNVRSICTQRKTLIDSASTVEDLSTKVAFEGLDWPTLN